MFPDDPASASSFIVSSEKGGFAELTWLPQKCDEPKLLMPLNFSGDSSGEERKMEEDEHEEGGEKVLSQSKVTTVCSSAPHYDSLSVAVFSRCTGPCGSTVIPTQIKQAGSMATVQEMMLAPLQGEQDRRVCEP
ncbi:hypothetical protein FQN60_005059, partial [Etheostoma spectabile]